MVGELVIGHSMVAQDETVNSGNYLELQRKVNHTDKIVRQVQDLSMSMRMIQFKATVRKIARLVRDLARRREIMINFIPIGEDTEIDRNMVDLINDPLVHLVRNAVDHGIEPPHERERNGKPREGTLLLKAYHSGGNVVVEISDDGRGLDRDKIIEKAIAKGLIQSGQSMSDSEIISLIFQPGFSTADRVTDISGRGVGLDVVRKAVETLRGRIDVLSEFGKGCTFSVRLPLTMAITDGMLVKVGNQRYILPTVNIDMSFRPNAETLSTVAGRGEVVVFNGKVLPIFRLHRLFNIKEAVEDPTRGLLIIIGEGSQRCALLVDELVGQQQVVAKSLGDGFGKVQGISGGAILGDGRVGLILDSQGIALLARQTSDLGIPKEVVCWSGT
jgi:two-component system chemotaxis sensor kinase CheA